MLISNEKFLQVEKRLWALSQHGCKSIHILLLAQIQEFQRNKYECYMTDRQFAENFGESERTIGRALDKLEELNLIKRNTKYVHGYGRANRQRTITVEAKALNKLAGKLPKEEKIVTYKAVQQEPAEVVDNRPEWEKEQMATYTRTWKSTEQLIKQAARRKAKAKEHELDVQAMLDNGEI